MSNEQEKIDAMRTDLVMLQLENEAQDAKLDELEARMAKLLAPGPAAAAKCWTPGCNEDANPSVRYPGNWCSMHQGIYPHECETEGCGRNVIYDDEPRCFTHSPDEGSSVRGYSAAARALANK